jgi:single-stranded DNA-binding protein
MKGIACAFEGRLGRDAEIKTARATGRRYVALSVIEPEDEQWINVVAWSESVAAIAAHLTQGVQLYIEGRLRLRHWESAEGPRSGLSVSAALIQPIGLIGARRPKPPRAAKTAKSKVDSQAPLDPAFNDRIDDLF